MPRTSDDDAALPVPAARHGTGPGASTSARQGPGVLAAAAVGLDLADELVVRTARDVHEAVRARVHRAVDGGTAGASRPVGQLHAGIAGSVYQSISLAARGAARVLRSADERGWGAELERAPSGRFVTAAAHGLVGDRLEVERPELRLRMALRRDARDLAADADAVAGAYRGATGDVVVLVHGLCEHDEYWEDASPGERHPDTAAGPGEDGAPVTFGSRLQQDLGYAPVFVRANTGLSVAENGAALSSLLDRLVAAWPVPVRRVALVGHSMGGLIVHAALSVPVRAAAGDRGPRAGTAWQQRVSDVVTLGTPHHGARLARGVDGLQRLLGRLPETAPLGRVLDARSRGVRDLEHGPGEGLEPHPGVRYRLVAATLGPTPRHPGSLALGDLLVDHDSALGRSRGRELFPGASTLHVGRADHFAMLHDERVYRALRGWLAEPPT